MFEKNIFRKSHLTKALLLKKDYFANKSFLKPCQGYTVKPDILSAMAVIFNKFVEGQT
jgi:hypothetical protein